MTRNQRDKVASTRQEGIHKPQPPTISRLWSGMRNPRIVRVSRAFGGKDRHSKVTTVRGLRDRRVRLSVPTAIQLYDLQDRLGLNQPSKVVDWLLNAAQHEIDKLPPLRLPPDGFIQFSQSLPISNSAVVPSQAIGEGPTTSICQSLHWDTDSSQRSKQREDSKELLRDNNSAVKGNDFVSAQGPSHENIERASHPSVSGFLSHTMTYSPYYQWEATNPYLSQLGIRSSQSADAPVMSIPSSQSSALDSQIVFCPPGVMQSMFPSNVATTTDFDVKQFGQLQMASSTSQAPQSTRPFQ